MEYKFTHKVDSHFWNPQYRCLLINLLHDPTFHYRVQGERLVKADLMPTIDWFMEGIRLLWKFDASFREVLYNAVLMGDFET